ncbi:MAG TPA: outer membrane beta-barrel protein, partial [Rhizomicrobium sp.]|nr:outer membrane beta-barrel protein [Rhizomicrobium sp.]
MKLRMLAMATVAAAALSAPAHAAQGWYLGLAGGYDAQQNVHMVSVPDPTTNANAVAKDNAIGALSFGYGFAGGWRMENEIAYTSHDLTVGTSNGVDSITSDMVNLVYDIPLGDMWKLSLGGGLGIGSARFHVNTAPPSAYDQVLGQHTAFQWQAIAGLAVSISPDVDLFGEYRYRSNSASANLPSSYAAISPVHVSDVTENVAMIGLRWFMTPPPPPPPPPP